MRSRKIGNYKIVDELGEGGMAVVYKAEQPSLDRLVAIKELREDYARDKSVLTRFQREALSVAALTHQNIVHVYDYIEKGENLYIAMEYVDGVDLYSLLERVHRFPPAIAGIIALQAARALEYAHYRGVIHRDLKPSNLMVTKQGEVKLMDFGIARDEAFDDLTRPGTALGTPAYMSPEQILGQRVDSRSDQFSFGIMLYQLLTGRRPFEDAETHSVVNSILHDRFRAPRRIYPDIPRALQRIVRRCLQKDPTRRFPDTEAMRAAIENYVSKAVRLNHAGRLVIYLRNQGLLTDQEAKTFVKDRDLTSVEHARADTAKLSFPQVVLYPVWRASLVSLVLLGLWGVGFAWAHGIRIAP